jgi:heme oxygenase
MSHDAIKGTLMSTKKKTFSREIYHTNISKLGLFTFKISFKYVQLSLNKRISNEKSPIRSHWNSKQLEEALYCSNAQICYLAKP